MALFLNVLVALLALGLSFALWSASSLYYNYLEASKIGVPVRIIPIDHLNKLWLLMDKQVVSLVRQLPGWLGDNNFTRFNYRGWHEADGLRAHNEMGEVFVLVTPARNWLYLANPGGLMDMYRRGKDFPRWTEITKMLDVFGGPNVATATGERWKVHRKAISACLNERCHDIVWNEAASLAESMVKHWGSKRTFTTIGEDTRTISLHVLCKALFGQSFKFRSVEDDQRAEMPNTFRSSLLTVLESSLIILALGPTFFITPWLPLPNTWKQLGTACSTFKNYMVELYHEKQQEMQHTDLQGDPTLMASLIRASQKNENGTSLTEDEIYGTMFVVSFAGHDTTAHLLTFAVFFLAANPAIQDWVAEELRFVLGDKPREEWSYTTDFPRLKRCMAILYETLRVKTPAAEVKWTSDKPQSLDVNGKTVLIPPQTLIIPSYLYVQKAQKFWGSDSLEWRPKRWIGQRHEGALSVSTDHGCRDGPQPISSKSIDEEILLSAPSRGNYLGWSEGTRDCPAKRFSQVEWVAFMAAMFLDWRVEAQPLDGETCKQMQSRVLDFIEEDTEYGGLLLQLMHPEKVPLVWARREE